MEETQLEKRKQIDTEKWKLRVGMLEGESAETTTSAQTTWEHMPTHVLHLLGKVTVSEPQSTPLTHNNNNNTLFV